MNASRKTAQSFNVLDFDNPYDVPVMIEQVFGRSRPARRYDYDAASPIIMTLFATLGIKLVSPPDYGGFAFMVSTYGQYDCGTDEIWAHNISSAIGELDSYLLHELIHWTGHPKRLNRYPVGPGVRHSRGILADEEYTAQLGMMLLAQELGVLSETALKHYLEQYIQLIHWTYGVPNIEAATEQAYRAVCYLRMLAPEVFQLAVNKDLKEVA